jgi:hypothetical protein
MTERRKPRAFAATSRNRRRGRRRPGQWPDATLALMALGRAWTTTVLASALFIGALAVAQVWDGAVFLRALHDALSRDPRLEQPIADVPVADPADGETPPQRPSSSN